MNFVWTTTALVFESHRSLRGLDSLTVDINNSCLANHSVGLRVKLCRIFHRHTILILQENTSNYAAKMNLNYQKLLTLYQLGSALVFATFRKCLNSIRHSPAPGSLWILTNVIKCPALIIIKTVRELRISNTSVTNVRLL